MKKGAWIVFRFKEGAWQERARGGGDTPMHTMRAEAQGFSLKVCVGFSIFYSVWFLLKFIFLFNEKHGLFDFKTSNSCQN